MDAFSLHLKRTLLQINIWENAVNINPIILSPSQFGWIEKDNVYQPVLCTLKLPDIEKVHTYNCKNYSCLKRCICKRQHTTCLVGCSCFGKCANG